MSLRWFVVTCLAVSLAVAAGAEPVTIAGWRADATGIFPGVNPVLEWGPHKNIEWATPLPSWGNASPVVAGGKLFVCAEPTTLVCVSLVDGQVLWTRSNNFEDNVTDEEAVRMKQEEGQANEWRKQIAQLAARIKKLKTDLQDKPDDSGLKEQIAGAQDALKQANTNLADYNKKWYSIPVTQEINGYSSATPTTDG